MKPNKEPKQKLFEIKNLVCSYDNIRPILFIPELDILSGEVTIILGKSGSGKSTLLETLGLMTKSLATTTEPYLVLDEIEGSKQISKDSTKLMFYQYPENESAPYLEADIAYFPSLWDKKNNNHNSHYKTIWPKNKNSKRQYLRLNHFAFIFQDTNLMDNFTAEENVAIAEMAGRMEEGFSSLDIEKQCIDNARETLKSIGIDKQQFNKKVKELSGGERQRVAFARAINARYSVVFGDEPTGNLDEKNSERLMNRFNDTIQHNALLQKKSAIIVSHNIALSLQFADRILLIDTHSYRMKDLLMVRHLSDKKYINDDTVYTYGKIDNSSIYYSKPLSQEEAVNGTKRQWFKENTESKEVVKLSYEQMTQILMETLSPK